MSKLQYAFRLKLARRLLVARENFRFLGRNTCAPGHSAKEQSAHKNVLGLGYDQFMGGQLAYLW